MLDIKKSALILAGEGFTQHNVSIRQKNIGISICDENHNIATPLTTIEFTQLKFFIIEIRNIISCFQQYELSEHCKSIVSTE